ncbi:MAG: hypothetical protein IPN34_05690 [Planctomycetes bacterium]|nr:hypothetical protein [Planctomycetota bacterium]
MPSRPWRLVALLAFASCSASPSTQPYENALRAGYTATEERRDIVREVLPLEPGVWILNFELSARSYRIVGAHSSDAELLVARAKEAQATRRELYATILIHEDAPEKKLPPTADGASSEDARSFPWIVVRLGEEPDPQLAR